MPLCLALLGALLGLSAGATAAEHNEQLLFAEPDGWHEVYGDLDENLATTEYVPEGQDGDDWREMLTVQILLGEANADPDTMLSRIAVHLGKQCPEFDVQPVELGGVDAHPTLAVIMRCGRNPESGRGDFILLRGIAGEQNFYLLQKAWQVEPYALDGPSPVSLDERKLWLGFLAYQRICDPAREQCPVGKRLGGPADDDAERTDSAE
ncbi:MAG: hypothetical protein H6977_13205 [Gammaproteobacteria bacterium]|nr:hypothetical protein [Gammaproteobacteria bacterium]MCP5200966.1 hypothetical protein [Gammaproteobacteria bacterium]